MSHQFRQWVKYIERYAQLVELVDSGLPKSVHITCTGSVEDFVKRYLSEIQGRLDDPSLDWCEDLLNNLMSVS
ncbi:hypothetical protein ScPMuIL_015282 [Solemya velum]